MDASRLRVTGCGAPVAIIADAGPTAGLGHISRSSAIAIALQTRGIEVRCFGVGLRERIECDGIEWFPASTGQPFDVPASAFVVDSYELSPTDVDLVGSRVATVVLDDWGRDWESAALVIDVAGAEPEARRAALVGLEYVALRPMFWGLPRRLQRDRVQRVLVTMGGGITGSTGVALANDVAALLQGGVVTLVRGPGQVFSPPDGVQLLDSPMSLLEPLLSSDVVICAGGQTMLEAAATGTPCIAIVLADNQRRQARRLAQLDAIALVDDPLPREATLALVADLAQDRGSRLRLGATAQDTIDGFGALRAAFAIDRLLRGMV